MDLVVVGAHHRSTAGTILHGSVTDAVVGEHAGARSRSSRSPAPAERRVGDMTDVPARTIVVGVDGSETIRPRGRLGGRAGAPGGPDLTLVHATGIVGTAALLWMDQAGVDSGLAMDGIRQDAEALLQGGRPGRRAGPEVRVRGVVAELDPRDALLELAPEADAGRRVPRPRPGREPAARVGRARPVPPPACPVVILRRRSLGRATRCARRRRRARHVDPGAGVRLPPGLAAAPAATVVHCIFDVRAPSGDVGPAGRGYDAERLLLSRPSRAWPRYPTSTRPPC